MREIAMRIVKDRLEKRQKTEHFRDNSGRQMGRDGPGKLEP
jgi:hypothetical protein